MQLQREDALLQRQFRVVVGEVQDQLAVHVVLDVRTLGDDHDIVPFIQLEQLLPAGLIDQVRSARGVVQEFREEFAAAVVGLAAMME